MAVILIVSDAWQPQVNGVVRSIEATVAELLRLGHSATVIAPDSFPTMASPFYREIRLAILPRRALALKISAMRPDAVHIATEGPLGWAARRICLQRGIRFTTAYHTRFPEYLSARLPVPLSLTYAVLRRFHNAAAAILVTTGSMQAMLRQRGFQRVCLWPKGVDLTAFPSCEPQETALRKPIMLYVGRLAVEKNIEAFLGLDLPGTRMIVGDGPDLARLRRRYPGCQFAGSLSGDDLASAYRQADVLVFPSLTDTFGLVMVEALACGTPIAAYPAPGPRDVLAFQDAAQPVGVLDNDLGAAIRRVLQLAIPRQRCRDYASRHFTWQAATSQFLAAALN